jgi:hypothetical protein
LTPYEHSILSVRDFGGEHTDYIKIHQFLDETKALYSGFEHRAILHNTWGMLLCERIFGDVTNNNVSVREVARRHILQDCQFVPTLQDSIEALKKGDYIKYNKPNKEDISYLKKNLYNK